MTITSFRLITIDGGAASGKTSTARALAERFGFLHVDTGSFYRAVTHRLLREGARAEAPDTVSEALSRLRLSTSVEGRNARIEINGEIPAEADLRSPEVNQGVSGFAALPEVRRFLLDYQRGQPDEARRHGFPGMVMEGRDIGTVVFPRADLHVFLEADPEERMRRRSREGQVDSVGDRDRIDSQRKTAPLLCPDDAQVIDSTQLNLQEVVERIAQTINSLPSGETAHPES